MYIKNLIKRTFIAIILFFFLCLIFDTFNNLRVKLLNPVIDFSYIKSKTNILLGNITKHKTYVSSEKIKYKSIEKYNNGYNLKVDNNYVIKSIKGGVVVFIGNKDDINNVVIINGDDGVNYWYGNLENINVLMYDYINTNTIIGSTKDNYLYLSFVKDNEYLDYEDFI